MRVGHGQNTCIRCSLFDICADAGHRLFGQARGIARDLFGSEEGHLIPAQELSGETELIAAYDALMRRGEAEHEQLKARMPSYMAGREETIAAVLDLAGGKRE